MVQIRNKHYLKQYALSTTLISSFMLLFSCGEKKTTDDKWSDTTNKVTTDQESLSTSYNSNDKEEPLPGEKEEPIEEAKTNFFGNGEKTKTSPYNPNNSDAETELSDEDEDEDEDEITELSTSKNTGGNPSNNTPGNVSNNTSEPFASKNTGGNSSNNTPDNISNSTPGNVSNNTSEPFAAKNTGSNSSNNTPDNVSNNTPASAIEKEEEKKDPSPSIAAPEATITPGTNAQLKHWLDSNTLSRINHLTTRIGGRDGFKGSWYEKIHGPASKEKLEIEGFIDDLSAGLNIARSKIGLGNNHDAAYLITYINHFHKNESKNISEYYRVIRELHNLITKNKIGSEKGYVGDGDNDIPTGFAKSLRPKLEEIMLELEPLVKKTELNAVTIGLFSEEINKGINLIGRVVSPDDKPTQYTPGSLSEFILSNKDTFTETESKIARVPYGFLRRAEEIIKLSTKYKDQESGFTGKFVNNYNGAIAIIEKARGLGWKGADELKEVEEKLLPYLAIVFKSNWEVRPNMNHMFSV